MGFVYLQAAEEQLKWMSFPRMSLRPAVCVCVATANSSSHHMRTAWDAAQAAGANVEMLIVVRKHQNNQLASSFQDDSCWNKQLE